MAFNDKINNNIDKMFDNKTSEPQKILDRLVGRAILNWGIETNLRYVKGREGDLGKYKPGYLIETLNERDREVLSKLKVEDIQYPKSYHIGWK